MMVTFISQCEKKSLPKTRRVLDAFASRIGSRTWQTVITQEGLSAVKKLLRQTATKNTAVACHWQRSRSRSELVWVVGKRDKFNEEGIVPVNYTDGEIKKYMDNYQWKMLTVIQYAAAIAALFHDFGKAILLFQLKLDPNKKTSLFEPYRHEWISLRIFQAFVGEMSDEEWLDALSQIDREQVVVCFKDGLDGSVEQNHPLQKMTSFARLIAWLILSHHKLPIYPKWKQKKVSLPPTPSLKNSAEWLACNFQPIWNSHNCNDPDQQDRLEQNWQYEGNIPFKSSLWRSTACLLAAEAKAKLNLGQYQGTDWLSEQLFTAHISRLCLMLADHFYSAQKQITPKWRGANYQVWANTHNHRQLQQLDEHLLGVAHYAQEIVQALPHLNSSLPTLGLKKTLTESVEKEFKADYRWQDDARKCSEQLAKMTVNHGFFGINMASTGKGKTFANAKIMYALGEGVGRRRFSVALGLRTLTLQTGREYQEKIGLDDDELAIVVGGGAAKQLFENELNKQDQALSSDEKKYQYESEAKENLVDSSLTIRYKGNVTEHSLSPWSKQERNFDILLEAPVLVSTIDHLMPATEGTKGGRQVAPMLRLLTSDLVLDEPDDFGLEDLPALCRLVHWAGLMGSRVLLSTATMPPALSYALFLAYSDGWKEYAKANIAGWNGDICCAWFDEEQSKDELCSTISSFKAFHNRFVNKRAKKLRENNHKAKQKGEVVKVHRDGAGKISKCLAQTIQDHALALHLKHHQQNHDGKKLSVGIVRMANIDPLVAVARELFACAVPKKDTAIHYCIYHSRYPLAIRSNLENKLDRILKRKNPDAIWQHDEIREKLSVSPCLNHIFIVLASPVAEVGRDHDYDWAIVEPSSMRSIIQLAGRVLRHRAHIPEHANILLLNKNYKALAGKQTCFNKPGFETDKFTNKKGHDLFDILTPDQYEIISAIPRIVGLDERQLADSPENNGWQNLVELEHKALMRQLFNGDQPANVWWKNKPQWCGEVQRQQRFRESPLDEPYYLVVADDQRDPKWQWKNEHAKPVKLGELPDLEINDCTLADFGEGNDFWFDLDAKQIYQQLAEDFDYSLQEVSERFGELRVVSFNNDQQNYQYHPNLGLFREREEGNE